MASPELRQWVAFLKNEKSQDTYFYFRQGEYHSSKLSPNHCLNAKWHSIKRAMVEGRYPDLPLGARLRMQMGEIVHREIQRSLDGAYQKEVVVKIPILDFHIICRADLLGTDEVIDIKTWTRPGGLPKKAEPSHLYQINTYLFAWKKLKGRLWYINYNTGEDVFFEHHYSQKMWLDVVAFTAQLHYCLTNEIEPKHKEGCRCRKK